MISKAFTLIEVLIATFIIVLVMAGAFTLIWQTTHFTNDAFSRLVAAYLCQEGIELMRHIRDSNWLHQRSVAGFAWDAGLSGGQWEMDYNDSVPTAYSGRYLGVGTFYSYDSGPATSPFQRKITIENAGTDIIKILVEVSWSEHGKQQKVTAAENLYNFLQL